MYARDVNKQTLTFAVSGMLWNRSLVMVDSETQSLWSHLLGKAMSGPLKGRELVQIPSMMTDWKTWRARHPKSTVVMLSRTSRAYRREFYRDPSRFVLGMVLGGKPHAWPFDQLLRQSVVNDRVDGTPVLVVYLKSSSTALAFRRSIDATEYTFENRGGALVDNETESRWNPLSGQALAGPMMGRHLDPIAAIVSYRAAWRTFHPNTMFWTAD